MDLLEKVRAALLDDGTVEQVQHAMGRGRESGLMTLVKPGEVILSGALHPSDEDIALAASSANDVIDGVVDGYERMRYILSSFGTQTEYAQEEWYAPLLDAVAGWEISCLDTALTMAHPEGDSGMGSNVRFEEDDVVVLSRWDPSYAEEWRTREGSEFRHSSNFLKVGRPTDYAVLNAARNIYGNAVIVRGNRNSRDSEDVGIVVVEQIAEPMDDSELQRAIANEMDIMHPTKKELAGARSTRAYRKTRGVYSPGEGLVQFDTDLG